MLHWYDVKGLRGKNTDTHDSKQSTKIFSKLTRRAIFRGLQVESSKVHSRRSRGYLFWKNCTNASRQLMWRSALIFFPQFLVPDIWGIAISLTFSHINLRLVIGTLLLTETQFIRPNSSRVTCSKLTLVGTWVNSTTWRCHKWNSKDNTLRDYQIFKICGNFHWSDIKSDLSWIITRKT